jgi:IS30 family transposase
LGCLFTSAILSAHGSEAQNENTNSLIRQYFPKKTDLSPHSQARLSEVATQLNEHPRKTLKFKTPSHMIEKSVALLA